MAAEPPANDLSVLPGLAGDWDEALLLELVGLQLRTDSDAAALVAPETFEGRHVCVALRDGSRIDDCHLVSAGRVSTETLWLFSNGLDVFIPIGQVLDVWEAPAARRAA